MPVCSLFQKKIHVPSVYLFFVAFFAMLNLYMLEFVYINEGLLNSNGFVPFELLLQKPCPATWHTTQALPQLSFRKTKLSTKRRPFWRGWSPHNGLRKDWVMWPRSRRWCRPNKSQPNPKGNVRIEPSDSLPLRRMRLSMRGQDSVAASQIAETYKLETRSFNHFYS